MSAPTISVIIPARDAANFIGATLDSLTAQSSGFEAVVIDDGSTDATADVVDAHIATDPRIRMIKGPATGVSAARNAGLAQTTAPFVLFLDADDLLTPDAMARLQHTLTATDQVAVLGGICRISEYGTPLPGESNLDLVPATNHLEALLQKNFVVNGGALLIRRTVIDRIGGYDPNLAYGEDWEFWCRLANQGNFETLPGAPVLAYRQRANGANYRARGSVFARNVPCIQAVARNASIKHAIGPNLRKLLRARQIDIFWSGVRSEYQFGARSHALSLALRGIVLYPDSVARPKLALRFLRSLVR